MANIVEKFLSGLTGSTNTFKIRTCGPGTILCYYDKEDTIAVAYIWKKAPEAIFICPGHELGNQALKTLSNLKQLCRQQNRTTFDVYMQTLNDRIYRMDTEPSSGYMAKRTITPGELRSGVTANASS